MARASNNSLTIAFAVMLGLRAVLAFAPGTWGWSLDLQRHAFPPLAWGLWGLAALALLPAVARAQAPNASRLAGAVDRAPRLAVPLLALAVGAVVFSMPDRTWFTGDFLLRVGVLESRVPLDRIAPQSMPLDLGLHVELPRRLASAGWLASPAEAARWLGALEAAALAAVALAVAPLAGFRGVARLAFAAVALGGSALALMNGYGKTAGELCVLTLAAGVLIPRFARDGKGVQLLALGMAAALLSHRSALLLLPAWGAAWIVAARAGRLPRDWPSRALGLGAPLVALALVGPRLAGLLVGFDLPRHLSGAEGAEGMAAWMNPLLFVDRLNVALAYAPLALVLLLPRARAGGPAAAAARPGVPLVSVALFAPALAMLLLVTPQQGLFRDWDVFAIPGTLLALAAGRRVAAWVGDEAGAAARAVPVAWSAALGAGLWLLVASDPGSGLARVRDFANGPPARAPVHAAKLWEFLGDRAAALGRWDDAARDLRVAVVHQPSPRLAMMLSMAEAQLGNLGAAEAAAALAARRDPSSASAWAAWATLAIRRGNEQGAREAALGLARIAPGHPLVSRVLGPAAADSAGGSR